MSVNLFRHVGFTLEKLEKMRFSQRKGLTPVPKVILREEITAELRNTIWSVLLLLKWKKNDFYPQNVNYGINVEEDTHSAYEITFFSWKLWFAFFVKPIDERPRYAHLIFDEIRKYFFGIEWHEFYDFLEFCLRHYEDDELNSAVNNHLEAHLSPFRFVGGRFTDITGPEEIEMIENALADDEFPNVRKHLKRALELLSDRKLPDYRNSIKESISAVESIAKEIAGKPKAELADALKEIEKKGKLHGGMKNAFVSLYGYTSDAHGIRHAMMDEPDLTANDAKFFLFVCTSFINYLKAKI